MGAERRAPDGIPPRADRGWHDHRSAWRRRARGALLRRAGALPGLRASAAMEDFPGRRDRGRGREFRDLPAGAATGPAPWTTAASTAGRSRSRSTTPATIPPSAASAARCTGQAPYMELRPRAGGRKGRKHGWHAGFLERLPRRGDRLPHRGHAKWPVRQRGRASAATHPAGHAGAPVSQRESAIPGSQDTPPVSGLPEVLPAEQRHLLVRPRQVAPWPIVFRTFGRTTGLLSGEQKYP